MESITKFRGFVIRMTHQEDGDMRLNEHLGNLIRPYPQAHGNIVVEFLGNNHDMLTHIDGIYTELPGVRIGCICADCPVLVLMGKSEMAVVHSGWRGTKHHIIESALVYFRNTHASDIQVFIGPHIQQKSYEVQDDFFEHFPASYIHSLGEKYYFDIATYIRDDLVRMGIKKEHIYEHGGDTYTEDRYFSYRRDGMVGVGALSVEMNNDILGELIV